MQTPKARNSSSDPPQKVSPRAVSKLKIDSASSSNQAFKTPKDRSPKVPERRSPKSPASEVQKRRSSKVSELESQVSQLRDDVKKLKGQLSSSESLRKQTEHEAKESKEKLLAVSSELEESQRQLLELSASEEARVIELQKISQERDQAWESELKSIQNQHSVQTAELAAAMNEIQQLKVQLGIVAESEATQTKNAESSDAKLQSLKENLEETRSLVEEMKNQLRDCNESESQARAITSETLLQLETAKKTVETLRLGGTKSTEAYKIIASELEQSRARVNFLEGLVSKLNSDVTNGDCKFESKLEAEVNSLKAALDSSEIRYHEEQIRSTVQIRSAHELVEEIRSLSSQREIEMEKELHKLKAYIEELKANLMDRETGLVEAIKSESSQREIEMEKELHKLKAEIEDLKANLMDKETELQGISEENEGLNMKLEKSLSFQRENEMGRELKKANENVELLKGSLMDKEIQLQNIIEENEAMKMEIKKRETERGKANNEVVSEVEELISRERVALVKLGYLTEEAEKSNRMVMRVAEELEAAQRANSEMEAELRKLKVQSDQWRKAAEVAASMLSGGHNGKFLERGGSLDSNFDSGIRKISSPFCEDVDDDLLKKKNGNVLKKIGVLWKKPQK